MSTKNEKLSLLGIFVHYLMSTDDSLAVGLVLFDKRKKY